MCVMHIIYSVSVPLLMLQTFHYPHKMSTYTVWEHWNVTGSLQRYMLKHAATTRYKNHCPVRYSTSLVASILRAYM